MAALLISILALVVSTVSTAISFVALRKGGSIVKVSLGLTDEYVVVDVVNPGRGPVQVLRAGLREHPSSPAPRPAAPKAGLAHGALNEYPPGSFELPMTLTGETTTGTVLEIPEQEERFRAWVNGFYLTIGQAEQVTWERIARLADGESPEAVIIRAWVRLGNGKTIYSPWWKPVALAGGNASRPGAKTLIKGYLNRIRYRAGLIRRAN